MQATYATPLILAVVDDDEVYSKFVRTRIMKDAPDFRIETFTSGFDLLEYLEEGRVDCILSDYQMPDMDGGQLLDRIDDLGLDIPFIFLTGQGSEQVARDAFKNGAYDYFTKGGGFAQYDRIINSVRQSVKKARSDRTRRIAEEAIRRTAEGVSRRIGQDFFTSLVEYLVRTLNVNCAFVGRLYSGRAGSVETVSAFCHGEIVPNFSYDMKGMPCENVTSRAFCSYPDRVQELFPEGRMLKALNVESYAGTPLIDSSGKTIGVMVVMDEKPIENEELVESLLKIFGSRAAAELDRMRSETALRESEAQFRGLVENSIAGVVLVQDRRFIYVNPRYAEIIGYKPDELKGDVDVLSLVHPDDRPLVEENIRKRVEGEEDSIRYSLRMLHKDGTPVNVEVHGSRTEYNGRPAVVAVMVEKEECVC